MKWIKYDKIKDCVEERISLQNNGIFDDDCIEYANLCANALISSDILNKKHTIAYRSVVYSACEFENLSGSKETLFNYYTNNGNNPLSNDEILKHFICDLVDDCCSIRKRVNNLETKAYKVITLDDESNSEEDQEDDEMGD